MTENEKNDTYLQELLKNYEENKENQNDNLDELKKLVEDYGKNQKSEEILNNQEIKSLLEKAKSSKPDTNIYNIIIDCNYVESCVKNKLEVIITEGTISTNILNEEKEKKRNKLKIR